ncbi:hypothetical protein MKW94_001936 [Papaver nudicaule]|uniref:Ribosome maturation protein SBDS n=1 Tax=Papaver nudicaule TaxID=74823 RepID=A0AA41RT23_PAPNU|nr:hypothetical protein [Papaver nudicaule]
MSSRAKGANKKPVGQKRLTNIAIVSVNKGYHGRFELACFKNKVLSWRSGVEKDIDEVLQSHTVYSSVSKGKIASESEMEWAFGTTDLSAVRMEILQKGDLQVGEEERDAQLSSQFRAIATVVMEKTINPETRCRYTIGMIERLMHEIHFGVDPRYSAKKQALGVIRELQKHFPIKRAPMRLKLIVPEESLPFLMEKLNAWDAKIVSQDEYGNQLLSLVCEIEPGFFRDCDASVKNLHGRTETLAVSVQFEKDTNAADHCDDHKDIIQPTELDEIKFSERLQKQSISAVDNDGAEKKDQRKCNTCNAFVGDIKQYREHFKTEWHRHNLRRQTRLLPPLTADECLEDMDHMGDANTDLKEYTF